LKKREEKISEALSEAFLKYRIFAHIFYELKGWRVGAYNHVRDWAFIYVDEIAKMVYDTYPLTWAHDVFIRLLSLVALHELTHEDHPKKDAHEEWDLFLIRNVWKYLR